jgi:hypothetical protein
MNTRFGDCPAFQIGAVDKKDHVPADGIRVMPAVLYLYHHT